jgi:hypothetical protein
VKEDENHSVPLSLTIGQVVIGLIAIIDVVAYLGGRLGPLMRSTDPLMQISRAYAELIHNVSSGVHRIFPGFYLTAGTGSIAGVLIINFVILSSQLYAVKAMGSIRYIAEPIGFVILQLFAFGVDTNFFSSEPRTSAPIITLISFLLNSIVGLGVNLSLEGKRSVSVRFMSHTLRRLLSMALAIALLTAIEVLEDVT